MAKRITLPEMFQPPPGIPVVDVRTPAEFKQGHIPGAFNVPLFSDEERVLVGTAYKQQSREAAILLGFELTGNKWAGFIRQALELAPGRQVILHCWRGGMRSEAMAWALTLYGFEVKTIQGGYKAFRQWAREQWGDVDGSEAEAREEPLPRLRVIGGLTGSGKTRILHQLAEKGEQIIDLEGIACHQGSVYGSRNQFEQPSQEQFENLLAMAISRCDSKRPVWVEDEGINLGRCQVPKIFWQRMQTSPLFNIEVPADARVDLLVKDYTQLEPAFLLSCTERIRKRLGHERYGKAVHAIQEGHMDEFIRLLLVYYDKSYHKALLQRSSKEIIGVSAINTDAVMNAEALLNAALAAGIAGSIPLGSAIHQTNKIDNP